MNRLEQLSLDSFESYHTIRTWRDQFISKVIHDHQKLNLFHEELMLRVANLAIANMKSELGNPPTHFAFFLMGSAARSEQSVWSDQDHGIIYEEESEEAQNYFLRLGDELTKGFEIVGYSLCDGNVMASNPLWCKSFSGWKKQMNDWMEKANWTSLRHLLTFFDSRVLVGESEPLNRLKTIIFNKVDEEPYLLFRMLENVSHMKNAIGVFGQFLVETKGEQAGKIHLKNAAFFPYVNSIRLLAIKEKIYEPSTLERLRLLPYREIQLLENDFVRLLNYRVRFQANKESYDDVHYLDVKQLTRDEKKELKLIIKHGYRMYKDTKQIITSGCKSW